MNQVNIILHSLRDLRGNFEILLTTKDTKFTKSKVILKDE